MSLPLALREIAHGALPGASDEILGLAFLVLAASACWFILKPRE